MPEWNGLGYQALAMQGIEAKKNRRASSWAQMVDNFNKVLATQQSQDWTLNKLMPAEQAGAETLQAQGDTAALGRQTAGDTARSGLQGIMNTFSSDQSKLYDLTAEQKMQQEKDRLAAASAASKTANPEYDFWTQITNAAKWTKQGYDPATASFDETLITDPEKLKKAFWAGTAGDPRRDLLRQSFNELMAGRSTAAPNPPPAPNLAPTAEPGAPLGKLGEFLTNRFELPGINIKDYEYRKNRGGTTVLVNKKTGINATENEIKLYKAAGGK